MIPVKIDKISPSAKILSILDYVGNNNPLFLQLLDSRLTYGTA